jgi:hypothetical protein
MTDRLPHVREPSSGEPDVCVHCREEWVDLLTLYERDECSVRLRGALDAERAAVVAWLRLRERQIENWPPGGMNEISLTYNIIATSIERGEHRRKEEP